MSNGQNKNPLLETSTVRIDYLSTNPEGMRVTTRNVLARKALGHSTSLTEEQAVQYRNAVRDEYAFQNRRHNYQEIRDTFGANSPEAEQAWSTYRVNLRESNKVGIRNPEFDDETNTLTIDVMNVPFQAYRTLNSQHSSQELLDFTEASGVAAVILTSDDKLIVQHRAVEKSLMTSPGKTQGNALYTDIPGTSAAGMFDATPDGNHAGLPRRITNDLVIDGIMKEVGEELGLDESHLVDQLKITGLAKDKVKPHHELMLYGHTHLTSDELFTVSRESNKNKNLSDVDFEEKFMTIEASPQAISTLLTQVKSPLPPTHSAAIFAAGYSLILEKDGEQSAESWRETNQEAMNENEAAIDQLIVSHYRQYPGVLKQVPERFWGKAVPARNEKGYSPNYTPEEQGLPSLDDELVRTGLKPETRTVVDSIHLFDIDGVLSNPSEKRVVHNELFSQIASLIENNEPVAFNTGRSVEWTLNNIVSQLGDRLSSPSSLKKVCIIGEKGNTWATFDEQGALYQGASEKVSIPVDLKQKVDDLIANDHEFGAFMTSKTDPHKVTMLSFEKTATPNEVSDQEHQEHFRSVQDRFANEIKDIIESLNLGQSFDVDRTTIATDIQSVHAGKDLGASRFLDMLHETNITLNHANFVAYGDSESDLAMANRLEENGLSGTLVYSGQKPANVPNGYSYRIANFPGEYSNATLNYLRNSEQQE